MVPEIRSLKNFCHGFVLAGSKGLLSLRLLVAMLRDSTDLHLQRFFTTPKWLHVLILSRLCNSRLRTCRNPEMTNIATLEST